jgi:glycosyltransferase involved in cell wall biosynthesis
VRTTFVVPVYNEAPTIEAVLRRLDRLGIDKRVIVVDDGSSDATPAILARWAAGHPDTLVLRKRNGGKGSALRAAIPYLDGEIAVIQDADLEYDPADVPALIAPIERGVADVVYGSRLVGGRPQRVHLFWHHVGNRALSLLTDVFFNTTLSDMESGYKAFRTDVLRELPLSEDGFGIEPEITAAVCRRHLRIYEVPVAYYGRSYAEGKKVTWRDGLTAVRVLVRARRGEPARLPPPHADPIDARDSTRGPPAGRMGPVIVNVPSGVWHADRNDRVEDRPGW